MSSSASPAGRAKELSFPHMVKLGLSRYYRKIISSLRTMRVFILYSISLFISYFEHIKNPCVFVCTAQLCPTLCNPMDCSPPSSSVHGVFQARRNTAVGSHSFLEDIFPTQRSNHSLQYCRQILYHLNYRGSPRASPIGPYLIELTGQDVGLMPSLFYCLGPASWF